MNTVGFRETHLLFARSARATSLQAHEWSMIMAVDFDQIRV